DMNFFQTLLTDSWEFTDFVDYVQEFVVFAVKKGNPHNIRSIADTCGLRVSVMAAGSAERVIKKQSEVCVKEGKKPVTVLSFEGQAAPTMALSSGRADAFFSSQAPLTYFVSQSGGKLELAAVGEKNGFSDIFQGAVLPKGSALTPVILEGMKVLFKNGTYQAVLDKWNLTYNKLEAPGINLATQKK
ncbi:transporter substrate-binding domain-containing protein, partial [uncultured Sutterella sp.]|uniref:transporter substrate-binding domain-containing protein n=1 Tax=uncultured Sutterella sp. TaxID=286133 RepID=UPI0026DB7B7A